jgi:hypothetical protein
MSATVTSPNVRQPVTRFGGLIAGAMIAIAVAALVGIAVYTFVVRDAGPAAAFDPTAAQRIHVMREYGSAASYDATPALGQHVVRENGSGAAPAAGAALSDHVLRENSD